MKTLVHSAVLVVSGLLLTPANGSAQSAGTSSPAAEERDGRHDFDFLLGGTWQGHNRRLQNPLSGSTRWVEFDATAEARSIMEGLGNMEEAVNISPTGRFIGLTLRLYDPNAHEWSIYWWNPSNGPMGVPTVGTFRNGRGEFFDQEMYKGRAILVRYVWFDIKENSARFEQSFSTDGGKSWEPNWITDWVRQKPSMGTR